MGRKARAVVSAAVTFALSVLLPLAIQYLLRPELLALIPQGLIDLPKLLNDVALIGVVTTFIALIKGLVDKASSIHLVVSVASNVFWVVFTFVILGLGSIGNLGITTLTVELEGSTNTVVVDLSLFVYLALATATLNVLRSFLEFRDARSELMEALGVDILEDLN